MIQAELKRYLVHNATTNGLANAVCNGLICYWLIKDKGTVTWWGHSNFGGDLLATGFILPFIVTLIVIPVQRAKLNKGKITSIEGHQVPRLLNRFLSFPQSIWANATLFGLIGALAIGGATLLLLAMLGVNSFTPFQYAWFKGIWAGLLAAILVGPMVVVAIRPNADTVSLEKSPS